MTRGAYVVPTPEQAIRYQIAISIVAELIVAEEEGKPYDLMKSMMERASGANDTVVLNGSSCQGEPDSFSRFSATEGRFDSALPD